MSALTPVQRIDNISGGVRDIQAKFTSVATGDTWATGLGVITGLSLAAGAAKVMSATVSGGTVTITVASGPDTGTLVAAQGY